MKRLVLLIILPLIMHSFHGYAQDTCLCGTYNFVGTVASMEIEMTITINADLIVTGHYCYVSQKYTTPDSNLTLEGKIERSTNFESIEMREISKDGSLIGEFKCLLSVGGKEPVLDHNGNIITIQQIISIAGKKTWVDHYGYKNFRTGKCSPVDIYATFEPVSETTDSLSL